MKNLSKTCLALILPITFAWACGSSGDPGDNSNTAATGTGGSLDVGGSDTAPGGDGSVLPLGGSLNGIGGTLNGAGGTVNGTSGTTNNFAGSAALGDTACSNGTDDDDDGLIDGFDPECTGPWDNDETSFATGIPGDNVDPKWQDCFFDGNSGAGDDDCRYATGCISGDLPLTDKDCQLTDACIKFCAPLTPNGCDCFGCCSVALPDGGSVDIQAAGSCSVDNVDDEEACPRCVKSDACGNTCGRCELCPGKTIADLPADCGPPTGTGGAGTGGAGTGGAATGGTGGTGGGPTYTCDGGEQVCGTGLPSCGLGKYCSQGCCLVQPPK
jgi:hypothetical protein